MSYPAGYDMPPTQDAGENGYINAVAYGVGGLLALSALGVVLGGGLVIAGIAGLEAGTVAAGPSVVVGGVTYASRSAALSALTELAAEGDASAAEYIMELCFTADQAAAVKTALAISNLEGSLNGLSALIAVALTNQGNNPSAAAVGVATAAYIATGGIPNIAGTHGFDASFWVF